MRKRQTFPQTVLVADDDAVDRMLLEEAFAEANLRHSLVTTADGDELLRALDASLAKGLNIGEEPSVGLVIVDLNMPRMNGHEVLAAIRSRPDASHIPVLVLTTSQAPADRRLAYELGAVSFVAKPAEFDALSACIGEIVRYWLDIVEPRWLPPEQS